MFSLYTIESKFGCVSRKNLKSSSSHALSCKFVYHWREKLSFGHALLSLVKSMHTMLFLLFFFTTTTFANHFGSWSSLIILFSFNRSTSLLAVWFPSSAKFILFCLIGLKLGSTLSLWVINNLWVYAKHVTCIPCKAMYMLL